MDDTGNRGPVWRRGEIESPCVQVCMIHPTTGLCVGCRRTGDEIATWSRLDPAERRRIMDDLPQRPDADKRRGGTRTRRSG